MRVISRFLMSASDPSHFPAPTLPEVAFLGRSNVGKSSVINSLLGAKVAKTSSTPGRTRSINFFEVRWPGKPRPELIFADLPGYGYAKVSREVSEQWPSFIEPYLNERSCLALCLALVDVNVPPQASDRQLLDFLESSGRPLVIVAISLPSIATALVLPDLVSSLDRPRVLPALYPTLEVAAFWRERVCGFGQPRHPAWRTSQSWTSWPDQLGGPSSAVRYGSAVRALAPGTRITTDMWLS